MSDPEELRETFDHFDADDNGTIEYGEFVSLLDALDAGLSTAEARIGFDEIDADDDHHIDFDEFLAWWMGR
jgi:Ca2+-binding EF-hand superfamily protein